MSFLSTLIPTYQKRTSLLHNIWAHDVAERLRIRRKTLAEQGGVPADWDVGTYPPYVTQRSGWLPGALLALAAAAVGAGGAYALSQYGQNVQERSVERTVERVIGVGVEVIPPGEE